MDTGRAQSIENAVIFTDLSQEDQREVLEIVRPHIGNIPLGVIEKDWWVSMVLRALFSLPYASHLSFKGGHVAK